MILKTEAIVLKTLKHQDSNLITTLYTQEFGIKSFIIRGFRSSRSRKTHSYFQPLSIVDVVFYQRDQHSLQKITETKVNTLLQTAQTHPVKLSLGLAVVEVFYDTVKEEMANPNLYQFLREVILTIDTTDRRLVHIFIYYLLHLTRHLGFGPNDQSKDAQYVHFDHKNGIFKAVPQQTEAVSSLLRRFLKSDLESCRDITFDSDQKRNLIKTLFAYYQTHIEGFRYPQTIKVFAEVFG